MQTYNVAGIRGRRELLEVLISVVECRASVVGYTFNDAVCIADVAELNQ